MPFSRNARRGSAGAERWTAGRASLRELSNLVDTRKVYLDALAQHYDTKEKKKAGELKQAVIRTLDVMSEEFSS